VTETASPTRAELLEMEGLLKSIDARRQEQRIDFYEPYDKQMQFHMLGLTLRERLLMAGNQNGKTYCGAAEASYHLTGLYPDWWTGRRWKRPTRAWVAGVTGESTRDNPQRLLLGTVADITAYGPGRGMIPKKCLDRQKMTLARGVSDLYDTVLVKHFTDGEHDGWSELKFKSYERGRQKWQGDTLDFIWYDEEPPEDIYTEGLARITATNGMVYVTFTPLEGMSKVVLRYLNEKSPDRGVVQMTIDDAKHIPIEEREKIIAGFPAHEREARARGVPMLGSGKIFQISEGSIECDPFHPPPHWSYLWATDFGVDHPFAAVLYGLNKDTDTMYVMHCIRMANALPLQHAAAMKPVFGGFGGKIPVAWPQDGWQRKEFDGKLAPLATIYKKHGLRMLDHHATWPDGSNSTELGILTMQELMTSNRFKVFKTCTEWFEEMRLYHRKDGEIVKLNDDLMSASRVGVMMKRKAQPVLWVPNTRDGRAPVAMARDVDIDPWG
jgi:phage terminase large subunit-like protein